MVDARVQWRLEARLSVGFLLDMVAIARGGRPVLDSLLIGAIIQANVQPLLNQPDLRSAFAQSDALPTDEMRRPVSVHALATSLSLPFETVRRRVKRLADAGQCVYVGGGVIVPTKVLSDPAHYADGLRSFERLRTFYYQLRDLDLLRRLPPPGPRPSAGTFPVRAFARQVGAYVLRVVEAVGAAGEMVDGLLILETFRLNVEDWPHDAAADDGSDRVGPARKPIAIATLAARIGAPHETVRRRIGELIERQVCAKMDGGVIVRPEALSAPPLSSVLQAAVHHLPALFAALSQLGVLEIWDSMRADGGQGSNGAG